MKNDTLTETLRAINRGASCKRDVQSYTGLSWGAVSETVNLLLENEIIVPRETLPVSPAVAGRKSSYFEFSRHHYLCMGMELHSHHINTSLISLGGKIIAGSNVHKLSSDLTPLSLRQHVQDAFSEQLGQLSLNANRVIALSFSLTGAIDCINRIWAQSTHVPSIRNYDFSQLEKDFPRLTYLSVEHDIFAKARAACTACKWHDDDFVFFHIGDGIGTAVHNQNGFFYGSRGLAGEIGHIPALNVSPGISSKHCSCGQENCLEIFLSSGGVLAFAREKLHLNAADLPELFGLATSRQMDIIYDYLHPYLLQAGIITANLYDPASLIIGGELIEPWLPLIQERFLPELQKRSWLGSPAEIKCYRMADCNSAFGAALNTISPEINLIATQFRTMIE